MQIKGIGEVPFVLELYLQSSDTRLDSMSQTSSTVRHHATGLGSWSSKRGNIIRNT